MYQPRIPVRFESADGSEELSFPLAGFTLDIDQDMDTPDERLSGIDGSWDSIGAGEATLRPIVVRLSFEAVEDEPEDVDAVVDEVLSKVRRFGMGKLWTIGRDENGNDVERWGWFRATGKPGQRWRAGDVLRKSLLTTFRGGPYWLGDTPEGVSEPVTTASHTFTVSAAGTGPVYWMVMRVTAHAPGGFAHFTIENLTNGYSLTGSRNAVSADDVMRIDTETQSFEYSADGGGSWSDDYASWAYGDDQVAAFRMEGGQDNLLRLTSDGEPNATFELEYSPVFE